MFTRKIEFQPAWDKTSEEPGKNFGVHGVTLIFSLKGKKGVIVFQVYTNWMLPHNRVSFNEKENYPFKYWMKPLPADIGYHAYEPTYEGQTCLMEKCMFLDDKPCYYDGSSLNAEPIFEKLIAEGEEGVWKEMENWYIHTFNTKE